MASESTPLLGSDDENAHDVLQEYPVYFLGMWFVGRIGKEVRLVPPLLPPHLLSPFPLLCSRLPTRIRALISHSPPRDSAENESSVHVVLH